MGFFEDIGQETRYTTFSNIPAGAGAADFTPAEYKQLKSEIFQSQKRARQEQEYITPLIQRWMDQSGYNLKPDASSVSIAMDMVDQHQKYGGNVGTVDPETGRPIFQDEVPYTGLPWQDTSGQEHYTKSEGGFMDSLGSSLYSGLNAAATPFVNAGNTVLDKAGQHMDIIVPALAAAIGAGGVNAAMGAGTGVGAGTTGGLTAEQMAAGMVSNEAIPAAASMGALSPAGVGVGTTTATGIGSGAGAVSAGAGKVATGLLGTGITGKEALGAGLLASGLIGGKSSTDVTVPGIAAPVAAQTDLEKAQLDQLSKANLYSDLITPVALGNAGYKVVTDPATGKQTLVPLTAEERLANMSPLDKAVYEQTLREMGLSPTGAKLTEDETLASMSPGERRSYELAQQNYELEKASLGLQQRQMGLSSTGEPLDEEQLLAQMSPTERRNYELDKAYQERQQQALSGTLPVSPAMEKQFADEEATLVNSLSMRLGPDWQLSTPGIKAMSDLKERHNLLREEARRGQISTGEVLMASSDNRNTATTKGNYGYNPSALTVGNYLNTLSGSTGNKLYSVPGLYGNLAETTGSVLNPYRNERMNVYNNDVSAAMQGSANKAALYGSLLKGGAQMFGSYYGRGY